MLGQYFLQIGHLLRDEGSNYFGGGPTFPKLKKKSDLRMCTI